MTHTYYLSGQPLIPVRDIPPAKLHKNVYNKMPLEKALAALNKALTHYHNLLANGSSTIDKAEIRQVNGDKLMALCVRLQMAYNSIRYAKGCVVLSGGDPSVYDLDWPATVECQELEQLRKLPQSERLILNDREPFPLSKQVDPVQMKLF